MQIVITEEQRRELRQALLDTARSVLGIGRAAEDTEAANA